MGESTDRIERQILINAPRSRVWRALSNAEEFGKWFGVALQGKSFVAGQATRGQITYPGYEHVLFDITIERMEPENMIAWRWHPYAVDPGIDYSKETATLVEIKLKDADGGTLVQVIESGFDQVPVERRLEAYRMNSGGWDTQMINIKQHVATP